MRLPDFTAAQLQAPRGGGSDPGWLQGAGSGRSAIVLGGAGGLLESPALRAAEGQIVIGTNWTLRALVPTIWHVVDADVYKLERSHLNRCPPSLVIVANAGIFGGGASPYSAAGSRMLRMVGQRTWPVAMIRIRSLKGVPGQRVEKKGVGVWHRNIHPPYLPDRITDAYHPGGNSLCYTIQTAHLMGCNPIYALGFTLQSGSGYFHGLTNPATRARSLYDEDRALSWLRWYEAQHPNRVRLLPGWEGPIYDVFATETFDEYYRVLGVGSDPQGESSPERDAVADGGDVHGVKRPGRDGGAPTPRLW